MEAFLLIAAAIVCDDRPDQGDRARLPSEPACRCQLDAARERVAAVEYAVSLSPSRAHLFAADLADARELRDWWEVARAVAQEPYHPQGDRCRMTALRDRLGAAEWWCGNWPILVPPGLAEP